MDLNNLLPKDKCDLLPAYRLEDCTYSEIEPIIPQLMEWLQDMNWPVSRIIAHNLLRFQDKLENEILFVLNTNDGMWKYWVVSIFGNATKSKLIQKRIIQIATNPTIDEINCDVNIKAREIIDSAKWS